MINALCQISLHLEHEGDEKDEIHDPVQKVPRVVPVPVLPVIDLGFEAFSVQGLGSGVHKGQVSYEKRIRSQSFWQ